LSLEFYIIECVIWKNLVLVLQESEDVNRRWSESKER